jgi:sulfatase maturation enzyme AslB (radical SAM superfamily)
METNCSAFWHHTNIRSDNRIFPCCRFKEPIAKFNGNVENILHLSEYEQLRQQSSSGVHISGCQKCYYEESLGKTSLRQKFNKEYDCDTVSLDYLEIGFDNICNLTCDGCWAEFSSEWGKKIMLLKSEVVKSTVDFSHIPNTITKVLFLGGEPLMTSRHRRFLESVEDLSKLSVIYNTNGTFLLDHATINVLKKCKEVEFIVSIDGYGDLNDQVRSGSKWTDILNFLGQITGLDFDLTIHTTIHLNNWRGLDNLSKFVNEHNYKWTVNILTYPTYLDIRNSSSKDQIVKYIQSIDIPNKDYIIQHVKS